MKRSLIFLEHFISCVNQFVFFYLNDDETIELAITRTEEFFRRYDMPTRLSDCNITPDQYREIAQRFGQRGWKAGERKNIGGTEVMEILEMCA